MILEEPLEGRSEPSLLLLVSVLVLLVLRAELGDGLLLLFGLCEVLLAGNAVAKRYLTM